MKWLSTIAALLLTGSACAQIDSPSTSEVETMQATQTRLVADWLQLREERAQLAEQVGLLNTQLDMLRTQAVVDADLIADLEDQVALLTAKLADCDKSDGLTFVTWGQPPPDAPGNVIEYCRAYAGNGNAIEVADWCADYALEHMHDPGWRWFILLQNLGEGDPTHEQKRDGQWVAGWRQNIPALTRHIDDALRPADRDVVGWKNRNNSTSEREQTWTFTPWMSNGIAEVWVWMDTFCTRLAQRIEQDGLPEVAGLLMDTEHNPVPNYSSGNVLPVWIEAMDDPRWETEVLIGFGRTAAQVWAGMGSPSIDATKNEFHRNNADWYSAAYIMLRQQTCAALNEAIYEPARAHFPGIICGNYVTAANLDIDHPPVSSWPTGSWSRPDIVWKCWADVFCPNLYTVRWAYATQNGFDNLEDATLAWAEEWVDSQIAANGGIDPSRMVPWIPQVGARFGAGDAAHPMIVTQAYQLRLIEMLKAKGVTTFQVWYHDCGTWDREKRGCVPGAGQTTPAQWREFIENVEAVR